MKNCAIAIPAVPVQAIVVKALKVLIIAPQKPINDTKKEIQATAVAMVLMVCFFIVLTFFLLGYALL